MLTGSHMVSQTPVRQISLSMRYTHTMMSSYLFSSELDIYIFMSSYLFCSQLDIYNDMIPFNIN